MQTQKPTLELLTCVGAYRDNPTALFHQLCGDRPATLLLESADIDSKDDLKSLLLVDSALRITALGDTVTIQALSGNGEALLALLDNALPAGVENEQSPNCRVLRFPPVSPLLDEDARLCSLSVFDAFRLLQNLLNVPKEEREAMFFGGLFSYDLVAGFEDLPQLSAENNCPDFCFYLAETLMVIDHQKKSTRIQASLFAPNEEEKQRLTARLNELRQQLTEAAPFPRPDYLFADIVGTGGDGSNSINISTASAFVAAACGLKVAKHGNRCVSSKSGSSDLLAAFGINLDMNADKSRQALDELGVCFLFAPKYHTGFRHAMPVRQQLKTRTLFNVLGPLINPAHPPLALIGVYSPELVLPIAETLRVLGYQRAAVVHSGGMDEVSLHAPTIVAELHDGEIKSYQLTAEDFGLTPYHQEQLAGGTPEENRDILTRLLQGKGDAAHEAAVAANVAMLMRLHGHEDLQANAQTVLEVLRSGSAYDRVTALAARG